MTRRDKSPGPDLHEFIRRYGGYANVPPEGWEEWDQMNTNWQETRRMLGGK
jgi:hypothetical protein